MTSSEVARSEALFRIPLNRFGTPSDMGAAVAFLASDDANYITGETIVVAGGMASKLWLNPIRFSISLFSRWGIDLFCNVHNILRELIK